MVKRYRNRKENSALYKSVVVKGGFGTSKASLVRFVYGNKGNNFWLYLSKPLPLDVVLMHLIGVFGCLVDDIHRTKVPPVELNYIIHLEQSMPLHFVQNKCVEALGELCI